MNFKYLSAAALVEINSEHGGPGAVLQDAAGVEAAAARPWSGFGDVEFFPTIWEKAAALLHGLASTQNFSDGNKRTGWIACRVFLQQNDEDLSVIDPDEGEAFTLGVATGEIGVAEAADWLFDHASPLIDDLRETGVCTFCETEGALPGAEFLPRSFMRRGGLRSESAIQDQVFASGEEFQGVLTIHPDRDLFPGVCAKCARGWMRLIDRRGLARLLNLLGAGTDVRMAASERKDLAAWVVKSALLRTIIEPTDMAIFCRDQSASLRNGARVPRGWTVWIARSEVVYMPTIGRLTWAALRDPADESEFDGQPTVVQYVTMADSIVLIACFNEPESLYGGPEDVMADLADSQYLVQLWPGEQHLILPVITYDDVSRISDLVVRLLSDLKAESDQEKDGPEPA